MAPQRILTTPSPSLNPTPPKQWHEHLTFDLFMTVLNRSILHPFIAWIIVLCLRAQATPYTHPAFLAAAGYAIFLTALNIAFIISDQIAYGAPRHVDLSEEVIVITGGASGVGRLIAQIYGLRGASVAVLDIAEEKDVKGWEDVGGVEYYRCDIGVRGEIEAVARKIQEDLGTPTVLVNCAATRINGQPLLSLSAEAFQKTIQTNLVAVFHTCQVFLPHMLSSENGGTIVNVSSVLGQLCAAGLADYSTSKAGLSALHRTLEAELRVSGNGDKVKMVLVETGQISTPLFKFIKTPNSFFAPMLEPIRVAQEIVSLIDKGESGRIRLPTYAMLINLYAALPGGLQLIARRLAGIDSAVPQVSFYTRQPGEKLKPQAE
ncbi:uncharacterized protein DSM5745_00609 [Aspergillus mulundensis]|uniref:Short-chain dehydrogenase/reductase family protein n=1 Tax=Aspergillus mulundensis TaxID=1810919 RepID=A0A3D8T403_9EURO|nr:hypothetical protein DSM5745_00609 [Aspergillus mulundensis]RDW93287.1 hypothetical protein DSM5745_00609 [Aspergillus mulundensis]